MTPRDAAIDHSRRKRSDVAASAFLDDPEALEAVVCDVEREAGEQRQPTSLTLLHARLDGVAAAHAAGDRAGLRGELVALAAAAAVWAARLPRPLTRGRGQ